MKTHTFSFSPQSHLGKASKKNLLGKICYKSYIIISQSQKSKSKFFTFSWPLRGRGGGVNPSGQPDRFFTVFFFDPFPYTYLHLHLYTFTLIYTYMFSWKLMALRPMTAPTCGLHLMSITSSSGRRRPLATVLWKTLWINLRTGYLTRRQSHGSPSSVHSRT